MKIYSRRFVIAGSVSTTLLASACSNSSGIALDDADTIDRRVDTALDHLMSINPGAQDLRDNSVGMLVMPLITEAGFGFGGSYGRGALRINETNVDYYSAAEASMGFQIGAQQFAHVLFFMTIDALQKFRSGNGFAVGADLKVAVPVEGERFSADTLTALGPVIAIAFGQAGLMAGVTLEGTKYTRINP